MTPVFHLNCDLGEQAGPEARERDQALLSIVNAANIACGAHAGDRELATTLLAAAASLGCEVGAHPGYPDRENFGRVRVAAETDQVADWVWQQLQWLEELARHEGVMLSHVKPHGALYHDCAEPGVAAAVAVAAAQHQPGLTLVGRPGSALAEAAALSGLPFAPEGFCDRRYLPDGSLVSRRSARALITDPTEAAAQAQQMVLEHRVQVDGGGPPISLAAATVCIHADTPGALQLAIAVRTRLEQAGASPAPLALTASLS